MNSFWVERIRTQSAVDGLFAVGLVLALGSVYLVDAMSGAKPATNDFEPSRDIPQPTKVAVKRLHIGVTPYDYDDVGRLLQSLGEGYRYDEVPLEHLRSFDKLKDFDVIFCTCGKVDRSWLGELVRTGLRANTEVRELNPDVEAELTNSLRQFVEQGGTLYGSDLRFNMLASAFEEQVDHQLDGIMGDAQSIQAEVVNPSLQELIGKTCELEFDQPGWCPAAFNVKEVFLRGKFKTIDGKQSEAPLLVRFPYGQGTVVFTSFHNDHQNDAVIQKLLQYLVFATVTAEAAAELSQRMVAGGFSPAGASILSTSSQQSKTQTFECARSGAKQFALAFRAEEGARFKLHVTGPNGRVFEKESSESIIIEVADAMAGKWECTVTAIAVPYQNFPFTLTIGEQ